MKIKSKTTIIAIFLVVIVTILTSTGQIFIKQGLNLTYDFYSILNINLFSGMVLYGIGLVIMLLALRQGEASVLSPILSLSYIWVVFLAFFVFGEILNVYKILGILIIFFGVSLIGVGGRR